MPLHLALRYRAKADPADDAYLVKNESAVWDPYRTAIIICDMWNQHWCAGATRRVVEMAPTMDATVEKAREAGVFIIHCPSDCMDYYAGAPQRKRAQKAPAAPTPAEIDGWYGLNSAKEPPLPIDDSDGGCDDDPQCPQHGPWTHQIDVIRIAPEDAITDSGSETYNMLQERGIENIMVMGVHTNMCVLGRPFSIRRLVTLGKHVVLVRDLTDTMYNSRRAPFVPHCQGTHLVVEHIEKHWCPTITSDQITGQPVFKFAEDNSGKG
jgi:nicotinamidase-related amidase